MLKIKPQRGGSRNAEPQSIGRSRGKAWAEVTVDGETGLHAQSSTWPRGTKSKRSQTDEKVPRGAVCIASVGPSSEVRPHEPIDPRAASATGEFLVQEKQFWGIQIPNRVHDSSRDPEER